MKKLGLICATALMPLAMPAHAAAIYFGDFSDTSGLTINGNAAAATDGGGRDVLRVTPATGSQAGSFFSTSTVSLDSNASFSTKFVFNINNSGGICDGDGCGADGIVFTMQSVGNNVGGVGGGIGYLGINQSVGIELDTWDNGAGASDPNGNHVAIDTNGTFDGAAVAIPIRMNNGADWYVWIDYNGITDLLELRLNTVDVRPGSAVATRTLDLVSILGTTDAFAGFTSGTGAAWGNHDIISWELRSTFDPIDVDTPEPAMLSLFGLGLLGLAARRRSRV